MTSELFFADKYCVCITTKMLYSCPTRHQCSRKTSRGHYTLPCKINSVKPPNNGWVGFKFHVSRNFSHPRTFPITTVTLIGKRSCNITNLNLSICFRHLCSYCRNNIISNFLFLLSISIFLSTFFQKS